MKRAFLLLCLALAGCATTGDRVPLRTLPEDAGPLPYAELFTRAKAQAGAANEAFYVDRWDDLQDAARGLEQTARFLPKATEVPANQKDKLSAVAGDLAKEATTLREAAKVKDVKKATDSLQRVHFAVRSLKPE
jgi:hypothetical protein